MVTGRRAGGEHSTTDKALDSGCQCGAVRYRIRGEPLGFAVCHCADCQRQSGSAFGMSLAVAEADFDLLAGTPDDRTILWPDAH